MQAPLGFSLGTQLQPTPSAPWWTAAQYQATDAASGLVLGAAAILNFSGQRYMLSDAGVAFESGVDFARPGTATFIDANGFLQVAAVDQPRFDYTNGRRGLLLEGPATNLLLNSDDLTTQSVTVSATTYTLSFYGTGTVTLSGSYSGSLSGTGANERVYATFTATAGSLTLTVSGSVTFAQLETGAYPTSYIPTAGSAVTRPADMAQLAEPVAALLRGGEVSVLLQAQLEGFFENGRFLSADSRWLLGQQGAAGGRINAYNGAAATIADLPVGTTRDGFGAAVSSDGSGTRMAANASSVAYNPAATKSSYGGFTAPLLGRSASGPYFSAGWYYQLVIWPFRMTDADLQAKAVTYA